jgi:hypothetical protein
MLLKYVTTNADNVGVIVSASAGHLLLIGEMRSFLDLSFFPIKTKLTLTLFSVLLKPLLSHDEFLSVHLVVLDA